MNLNLIRNNNRFNKLLQFKGLLSINKLFTVLLFIAVLEYPQKNQFVS
jgi:hypothetical protein